MQRALRGLKITSRANQTDVEAQLTEYAEIIIETYGDNGIDMFSGKGDRIAERIRGYLERTIGGDVVPLDFRHFDSANEDSPEKAELVNSVFQSAFPTPTEMRPPYFNIIYQDNTGELSGFWQWNSRHNILVRATLDILADGFSEYACPRTLTSAVFRG
ncbi:hypothetical protein FACS1894188_06360 [Clostridia bacterium]|nr:hypothetical protein FACS1894188_06360 [Clostridia bacterium]